METSLKAWVQSAKVQDVGTRLEVVGLASTGRPEVLGRLADFGISSGETLEYFGTAPLDDPILISVRDTVVALRSNEAELILVGVKSRV